MTDLLHSALVSHFESRYATAAFTLESCLDMEEAIAMVEEMALTDRALELLSEIYQDEDEVDEDELCPEK